MEEHSIYAFDLRYLSLSLLEKTQFVQFNTERGFTKIAPRRCVAIAEPVGAAKSCSYFPLSCVGAGQDFTAPIFGIPQPIARSSAGREFTSKATC
jgi:hypothetical protein